MKRMMREIAKRSVVVWVALMLCVFFVPCGGEAAKLPAYFSMRHDTTGGAVSYNQSNNTYNVWADVVSSNLIEGKDGGFTRVEYMNHSVVVEQYSSEFEWKGKQQITVELPLYGGFFAGENDYFLYLDRRIKRNLILSR